MDCALMDSNDRDARFEKWLDLYATTILRMSIIYLNDVALAEAATQEAFLKAHHHMVLLKDNAAAGEKACLMRIAVHICRKYWRAGRLRSIGRYKAMELPNLSLAALAGQRRELLKAIMGLPARHKEVVLLSHYQDMTMEDVGKILRLSKPAVQLRLKTAMEKIRSKLERWYFDE